MKKMIFLMVLLLVACAPRQDSQQEAQAATTVKMRFHCDGDTTLINELLMKGYKSGIHDANGLIEFYARQLLGTPYVAHTLEADEEILTINIHELDCLTFIETLYALTRATLNQRYSWRDYAAKRMSATVVVRWVTTLAASITSVSGSLTITCVATSSRSRPTCPMPTTWSRTLTI